MKIYFDLDGTIANLYGVENWLDDLITENVRPYAVAAPLVNLSLLARTIHKLEKKGYEFGVISWLSKNSTREYDEAVRNTKMEWLKKHLPSVEWSEIFIVSYGTPKSNFKPDENAILFDDEERNRIDWGNGAYDVQNILETLKSL